MQTDFTEKQLSRIHFKANLLLSTIFAAVFSVTGTIISRHFSISNTIIGFILAFIFIFVVFLVFDPKTIIDIRVKPEERKTIKGITLSSALVCLLIVPFSAVILGVAIPVISTRPYETEITNNYVVIGELSLSAEGYRQKRENLVLQLNDLKRNTSDETANKSVELQKNISDYQSQIDKIEASISVCKQNIYELSTKSNAITTTIPVVVLLNEIILFFVCFILSQGIINPIYSYAAYAVKKSTSKTVNESENNDKPKTVKEDATDNGVIDVEIIDKNED